MTNYRIFLLAFLTVSWVFLTGLKPSVENGSTEIKTPQTAVEPQALVADQTSKQHPLPALHKKPPTQPVAATHDTGPINGNGFEKPLDLSVPFKAPENTGLPLDQKTPTQSLVTNIFAPATQKKTRPLELDGDFLMSPEPEVEKQKSVDGAGFIIRLKP